MNRKKTMKREYQAYLYILPWILGFAILQLYPFVSSFIYSFTDYTVGAKATFQGLANYKKLFTQDKEFWNSLKVTILFAAVYSSWKTDHGLSSCHVLKQRFKRYQPDPYFILYSVSFWRKCSSSTVMETDVPGQCVINAILSALHLPVIQCLGDTRYALRTICMLEIWQFGSSMVMFLAALKQVPRSLYEAAEIDGAGKVTRFFHITLPQISPIIFFNLINQTIQALQNFTSAQVITEGGPLKSTYVLGLKLYKEGFSYFKMGYASAISWVVFAAIMIFTLAIFASSKLWVHYADE